MSAEDVHEIHFDEYMRTTYQVKNFIKVCGPDYYYESGENVLRHRVDRVDHHELTVKCRKSTTSTRDRLEVDLHFAPKTTPADVQKLLGAIGFKKVINLVKDARIYWVQFTKSLAVTFVLYDSWLTYEDGTEIPGTTKRFIEIEAEKGSNVSHDTAKRYIRNLVEQLREKFKLGEPLNESLWEIYSGKKYKTVSL